MKRTGASRCLPTVWPTGLSGSRVNSGCVSAPTARNPLTRSFESGGVVLGNVGAMACLARCHADEHHLNVAARVVACCVCSALVTRNSLTRQLRLCR